MKINYLKVLFLSFSFSFSQNYSYAQTQIEYSIPIEDENGSFTYKKIRLMDLLPTEELIERNKKVLLELSFNQEIDYSSGIKPLDEVQGAVDIKMNNAPVLDQGQHGTCLTFAATGALNARFGQGDYVDQQCFLALSKGLGYNYWNGAQRPDDVYNILKPYGIVPKGNCFGVQYGDESQIVYPNQYTQISEKKYSQTINTRFYSYTNLDAVKQYVKSGYRVLFSFMLAATQDPKSVNGFNALIKGVNYKGGLWACTQPGNYTNYCEGQRAGHEVIVTGYDDTQQLLKIRNSWGDKMGEKGEYYMTYSFFRAMSRDMTIMF